MYNTPILAELLDVWNYHSNSYFPKEPQDDMYSWQKITLEKKIWNKIISRANFYILFITCIFYIAIMPWQRILAVSVLRAWSWTQINPDVFRQK